MHRNPNPSPKSFHLRLSVIICVICVQFQSLKAQDPAMLQAFYWNVPEGGTWWENLEDKMPELGEAGFSRIWIPSPFKGQAGKYDMGFSIYDHYDAGDYWQNGTIQTRFGSRAELEAAIDACHSAGMEAICELIFNHVWGGNLEHNPDLQDYILNKSWYPVYGYGNYKYVFDNAPAGRYYVQLTGNQYDHSATSYDDREGYYSIRPWFNHSSGQNADGEPNWYEWDFGDGDSGPFDATLIDLPGRVMEGQVNGVGDIDEYYIDHEGGWLEFGVESTDFSGTRDFIVPQLWYDPDTSQSGDDYDASASLLIYSYTNIQPASGRWAKDYSLYHPTTAGHHDIDYEYHYPYFGNDLCYANRAVLDSMIAWGEWLDAEFGFDGFRFDVAKGIDPYFVAQWVNHPAMSDKYYVGEHWSSVSEIQYWVDAVNNDITGSTSMTAFDFPLFYELQKFCDDAEYNAADLHNAGLHAAYGHGLYASTFVHNHDVFRPYDIAHNPIVNNSELAYAYILTHPGTATVFYPDYYGGTFYSEDSSQSFTMAGLKSEIDNLLEIRRNYAAGPLHLLTANGSPEFKPADDCFHGDDFSYYSNNLYVAQREGSGDGLGGLVVVLNSHWTDDIGAWVTLQGNGVGADLLRDHTGNRGELEEVQPDNRVFVHAPARSYSVWAFASPMAIDLQSPSEPATLPPSGGNVPYRMQFTNLVAQQTTIDLWNQLEHDTEPSESLFGPVTKTFAPSISGIKNRSHVFDATDAAGEYRMVLYIGTFPDTVIDSDTLFIIKNAAGFTENSVVANATPSEFALLPNFPNPFNPETTIQYALKERSMVTLRIIDIQGRSVLTPVNTSLESGWYTYQWSGRNADGEAVGSGVYIVTLTASSENARFSHSQKMILLK